MKTLFCIIVAMVVMVLNINAQLPTEGLVGYWSFSGNAQDESGNGNNGTVNGATLDEDRYGNSNSAYSFDGSQNVTTPFTGVSNSGDRSISFWVKMDVNQVGGKAFNYGDVGFGGSFNSHIGNGAQLDISNSTVRYQAPNLDNQWHHYVYMFSTQFGTSLDGVRIYMDGILLTNILDSYNYNLYTINTGDNPLTIGGHSFDEFQGSIDDFRFYNRILDASEITSLYNETAPVTDIDGNQYNTVTIGNQVWMAENLKTTKYQNGDEIGTTTPATLDISGETSPKYQWAYNGSEANVNTYGRLYTWYAVADERNICPAGWHVPSDDEWKTLEMFLGMTQEQADGTYWRGTDQGTQIKSEIEFRIR